MRNKRGQFYLLAAIIIITVIVGLASVSNYVKKGDTVKLYDVREELNIESGEVLEYGQFSGKTLEETTDDFIVKYQEYAGDDKELYFVYGDKNEVYVIRFGDVGKISLTTSGTQTTETIDGKITTTISAENGPLTQIDVLIGEEQIPYTFELKPGQNFFFVISQEVEGEQHIVQS